MCHCILSTGYEAIAKRHSHIFSPVFTFSLKSWRENDRAGKKKRFLKAMWIKN
jgi:hypothetical protein